MELQVLASRVIDESDAGFLLRFLTCKKCGLGAGYLNFVATFVVF